MENPSHVIVLMLENRSFDHMLGFLPGIGDLTGDEFNLVDPSDPASDRVFVSAPDQPNAAVTPSHEFVDTHQQLFGGQAVTDVAPMNGFVCNALANSGGNLELAKAVMECQSPRTVPVLSRLATDFCACTRWFSSIPGPTFPNRYFLHAATSTGLVTDTRPEPVVRTIQATLAAHGLTWRVYAGDVPQCLAIESLFEQYLKDLLNPFGGHHFHGLGQFFADLKTGSLPNYAFLEPHYFETPLWHAQDQHPPHKVEYGEALLSAVVAGLIESDYWEDSLFVILYDEHGGFYDKLSPPDGVPNPDGRVSVDPPFDFTRLGVRVPAVLVSPFIEAGTIDATVYDHSSVPATLNKIFELGAGSFLTNRDRAANTFEKVLTRATPRPRDELRWATAMAGPREEAVSAHDINLRTAIELAIAEMKTPEYVLSDFQKRLVDLVRAMLPRFP